ncbi:hypothetical protein IMY05_C4842000400 [Salix suchowensis]|nr:hypothetical protein IMY05_C4842000400 [Salix suchowensis]
MYGGLAGDGGRYRDNEKYQSGNSVDVDEAGLVGRKRTEAGEALPLSSSLLRTRGPSCCEILGRNEEETRRTSNFPQQAATIVRQFKAFAQMGQELWPTATTARDTTMMVCTTGCQPCCLHFAILIDILIACGYSPTSATASSSRICHLTSSRRSSPATQGESPLAHITDSFQASRWQRSGWESSCCGMKRIHGAGGYMCIKDSPSTSPSAPPTISTSNTGRRSHTVVRHVLELDPWGPDAMAIIPERHYNACYSQPYIGECILSDRDRASHSGIHLELPGRQLLVVHPAQLIQGWPLESPGWEVLVCKDGKDTWRMGIYIYIKRVTVYVTVKGVGDVEIEYGRDDACGMMGKTLCDDDEQLCPRILSDIDIKRWRESVWDSYDEGGGIERETSEAKSNLVQGAFRRWTSRPYVATTSPALRNLICEISAGSTLIRGRSFLAASYRTWSIRNKLFQGCEGEGWLETGQL